MSRQNSTRDLTDNRTDASCVYGEMLFNLALCKSVPRSFVLSMTKGRLIHQLIKKGIENNHIKEETLEQKINSRLKTIVYYSITKEGLIYLANNFEVLSNDKQWIKYICVKTSRLKIKHQGFNTARLSRHLNICGSAFFCAVAGAEIDSSLEPATNANIKIDEQANSGHPLNKEQYDKAKNDLRTILDNAKRASTSRQSANENPTNVCSISFIDGYKIKALTSLNLHSGRFTGILENQNKSALLYVGNKEGMSWSERATLPEKKAHHAYSNKFSRYKSLRNDENHGILLVENARDFANLYEDKKGKRKKEDFADKFTSFIIIPISYIGVMNLREYMMNDREEYEQHIINSAIQSGIYQSNREGFYSLFPLTKDDIPIMLGVFIDTARLNRIKKIMSRAEFEYGILCYPWQVDYYHRVMPEALIITMRR